MVGLLNDDFTGGEFVIGEKTTNLTSGDIVVFPSNFMFPHKVNTIDNGRDILFCKLGLVMDDFRGKFWIFDDIIDKEYQERIKNTLLSHETNWFYNHNININSDMKFRNHVSHTDTLSQSMTYILTQEHNTTN